MGESVQNLPHTGLKNNESSANGITVKTSRPKQHLSQNYE